MSFGHLLFHLKKKNHFLTCVFLKPKKGKGSFTQLLLPPFTLG